MGACSLATHLDPTIVVGMMFATPIATGLSKRAPSLSDVHQPSNLSQQHLVALVQPASHDGSSQIVRIAPCWRLDNRVSSALPESSASSERGLSKMPSIRMRSEL
jgi:hypothetical protein